MLVLAFLLLCGCGSEAPEAKRMSQVELVAASDSWEVFRVRIAGNRYLIAYRGDGICIIPELPEWAANCEYVK